MKYIKEFVDDIKEELCGAKDYAEKMIYNKAAGNNKYASYYETMAQQELSHSSLLHEMAVEGIERLRTVYQPSDEMQQKWDEAHQEYVKMSKEIKDLLGI